eukprot:SAG25_NODE_101_length_15508_cov_11.653384_18_plen_238_part_00
MTRLPRSCSPAVQPVRCAHARLCGPSAPGSGGGGGYDTSDPFINDSVDSAQEDDFDVEMTGDALGRRHSAPPVCYTDTEHAAQLQEVLSDDDEFAVAAGTASSDEDDDSGDSDGSDEVGNDEGVGPVPRFGEVVDSTRMRAGARYLVLAPGVQRVGAGAGARDVSARAGIGVLSLVGSSDHVTSPDPPAEFLLLNRLLPDGSHTYRGVRMVERCELGGFRFVRMLGASTLPPPLPEH